MAFIERKRSQWKSQIIEDDKKIEKGGEESKNQKLFETSMPQRESEVE